MSQFETTPPIPYKTPAQVASELRTGIGVPKIFATSQYGASPTASASANVAAIQEALDAAETAGGGFVLIDIAGEYDLNGTLFVGNNTVFEAVPGVTLAKTGSGWGEVIANKGAATGTTNCKITIRGFTIDTNGIDAANHVAPGMRSVISLFHVEDVVLENCVIDGDGLTLSWALTLCDFVRAKVSNLQVDTGRDGLHIGTGDTLHVSDCKISAGDDCIALHCSDYPNAMPQTGSIRNVLVERVSGIDRVGGTGYFSRSVCGAWKEWTSGDSYLIGNRCVNAGNVYVCTSPTTAAVASNAPVHTSGIATGADGIAWRFDHVGTDTAGVVENLIFRDCRSNRTATFYTTEGNSAGYNNPVTAGEEINTFVDGLRFENCTHEKSSAFSRGQIWVKNAWIYSCRIEAASVLFQVIQIAGTSTTDPRAAHTTSLWVDNCKLRPAGTQVFAAVQSLSIFATVENTNEILSASASSTGLVYVKGSVTGGDSATNRGEEGNRVKYGVYAFGRWVSRNPNDPSRVILPAGLATLAASGADSFCDTVANTIRMAVGTTKAGYATARFLSRASSNPDMSGNGINFSAPFTYAGRVCGAPTNHTLAVLRFLVGAPTAASALANSDAFTDKGIGFEIGAIPEGETDAGFARIRLVYRNNSAYVQGDWFSLGGAAGGMRNIVWAISNLGNGTIKLFAASGYNVIPATPTVPLVTVTNGPTSGQVNITSTFVGYSIVGDATTDPPIVARATSVLYPVILDMSVIT